MMDPLHNMITLYANRISYTSYIWLRSPKLVAPLHVCANNKSSPVDVDLERTNDQFETMASTTGFLNSATTQSNNSRPWTDPHCNAMVKRIDRSPDTLPPRGRPPPTPYTQQVRKMVHTTNRYIEQHAQQWPLVDTHQNIIMLNRTIFSTTTLSSINAHMFFCFYLHKEIFIEQIWFILLNIHRYSRFFFTSILHRQQVYSNLLNMIFTVLTYSSHSVRELGPFCKRVRPEQDLIPT